MPDIAAIYFPQFEGFMMDTKTGEVRATLEDPDSNDKTRVTRQ